MSTDNMINAAADDAAIMPTIANKKILMGFWHNWAAGASDGYQQGQFANMNLTDIPAEYNVVAVAFMKGQGIPTFKPYNLSDAEFRRRGRAEQPWPRGADLSAAQTRISS